MIFISLNNGIEEDMVKIGDDMDDKLTEIAVKIGKMETTIKDFVKQQEKQHNEIHNTLYGNGQKGLVKSFSEFQGGLGVWKILATGGFISGVIAFISMIKDYFIK